ncbi:hypothetical protein CC2G_010988 [Coprinopsis cinerea AmutBmut pab1-1]|nr:hypothetical protein CC2G_010988 [Coprinopsis cinerea AmutBmut pab1-1]
MTTLITGGGSKVGSKLALLLEEAGRAVLFGSRSGRVPEGFDSVHLDWNDPSTFTNPWSSSRTPEISYVYIVAPITDLHHAPKIIPFIDLALEKGVKRFVYLSATIADRNNDSGGLGAIPRYLEDNGLDYLVLRPTWFIDNLESDFREEIVKHGTVTTCIAHGRTPFVAVDEIAKVAFDAIVNLEIPFLRRDPLILGPEFLTYQDVANLLSEVLKKRISVKLISFDEALAVYRDMYEGSGLDEVAEWLVELDKGIENGSEERYGSEPGVVLGKVTMREWVEKNRHLFV